MRHVWFSNSQQRIGEARKQLVYTACSFQFAHPPGHPQSPAHQSYLHEMNNIHISIPRRQTIPQSSFTDEQSSFTRDFSIEGSQTSNVIFSLAFFFSILSFRVPSFSCNSHIYHVTFSNLVSCDSHISRIIITWNDESLHCQRYRLKFPRWYCPRARRKETRRLWKKCRGTRNRRSERQEKTRGKEHGSKQRRLLWP